MKELLICTIGFGDDQTYRFGLAFTTLRSSWIKDKDKFFYKFVPASVSYVQGGTHVITCDDSCLIKQMTDDINRLLRSWPSYKLEVRDK